MTGGREARVILTAVFDEIRKSVGSGSAMHPRLSVQRKDASQAEVVVTSLVKHGGTWTEDRTRPPMLVPLTLLGCRVTVEELVIGDAYSGTEYEVAEPRPTHGGPLLRTLVLQEADLAKEAMKAGGELPFEAMKVPQLKEELAARDAKRSGLKAALQRRLHGLLVQAAILSRGEL